MTNRVRDILSDFKKNKTLLFMLLPTLLFFLIFSYLPMIGLVIAFQRFDFAGGIFHSEWVWFDNFLFFFESGKALSVTLNTVLYNAAIMTVNTVLQVTLAIFLAEITAKYFKKIAQTLMLLPYFISWVVVSSFIYNLFNYEFGTLNSILKWMGLAPIDFMGNIDLWKYIIVFFAAWNTVGYGTIVYLAAITGIDRTIYESAEIDGANIFQRIYHITLPALKPIVVILLLMGIGGIFRGNFDMFYQIVGSNGLLYPSTDVIDTYVFRSLVNGADFGRTTAIGLYQSILSFILLMISNSLVKKVEPDYSLF